LGKIIVNKLFEYLPVLFSFLLPFGGNYLSLIIILWFIISLFCFSKEQGLKGIRNPSFLVVLIFFMMHCLSAAFSSNKTEALTSIEVKMSFLAFPYFFFLFKISTRAIKQMLAAFVSGCLFALLFLLGRAAWIYFARGENYFFYNDFSWFIHAGYFSMYLLLSLVIVQLAYPAWFGTDKLNKPIRYLFSALFITGIFLCASKIGLIAFALVAVLIVAFKFGAKANVRNISVSVCIIMAGLFIAYKVAPAPFERLLYSFKVANEGTIDKTSSESTAVRMLIWEQCREIIKENFIFGTGTGDANDELQARYVANGLTGAREHNLNAHNQFFQTFIALGVFGFIVLLVLTLGTMIRGFISKNVFLWLFSLLIILNFLVESMLQTQAGNLFYVFFLCLFLSYNPLLLKEEKGPEHV